MELTPQQWEIVKALFETALEKPPAERTSFLAQATQDSAVRTEVERLLSHHLDSGSFLSKAAVPGRNQNRSQTQSPNRPSSSSSFQAQSFRPGELVAERFRITCFLARGGMGEVYEAEDIELHERVALKSIRSELLDDGKALDRFKREVHLARKVTHPNVCRIFDLFRQAATSAAGLSRNSVLFVAMELLEGETLADFLRRQRRLSVNDALPIALQMAVGLGAAHAAGVLHRDFKPDNVVLVKSAKGLRAVITDFGLALRSDQAISDAATVTGAGEIAGTPAYMSPEQVEGKDLTPASDVYSFGLVLYQMVTGTRPFEDATTPLAMAVRRIKEAPAPPRTLVPDLDPRWDSLIVKCLQREPKARFQSGDEVAEALRPETKHHGRWNSSPRIVLETIALIMLIVLGAVFLTPRIRRRAPALSPAAKIESMTIRPSVAILPFHNLSGRSDTDWVSTALPEMLTAELAAGGKLRTFPGENIARASADLKLTGMQTLARDTLTHFRKYLGSDYVVLGSYLDHGNSSEAQVRLDLWLQDTKTGEIAATVSEKGSESELDDLATRAGADLRQKLGVGEITPAEASLIKASLPSSPEAVRLYSEGLAKLRVADALAARDLLEHEVAADPKYALGHSALADAWAALGYDQKARQESKQALDLSSGLSHEKRLWIEGKDWELNRQWNKAVEIYRTLFDFFPDNLEYGLHLAAAQKQARTLDEALATLAALQKLPAPDRDDPRIALQQADVFDIKGAYKEQEAAAESAASRARELGATLLLARALNQQARSFEKQGKLDDALRGAQEAQRISEAAGERAEVAKALTITGIVRFDQGNFAAAANAYNRALVIQRESGDMRAAATTLNNLANALGEQGDLSGSIKMLNEALATFREVGDKHSVAAVLGSMAARIMQQGNLNQGKKMLEQGLAASQEIGDQERTSTAIYNLGEVLRWQGDLKGARKKYEQAEAVSKQIGDQSGVAYALYSLGDVSTAEGLFVAALDYYNQSIALRTQMGEKGNVAESQMALALLLFEEGDTIGAESSLREAREEVRKEAIADDEILADTLLARILLSQGKLADAHNEVSEVHDLLAKSQDLTVHLRASVAEAQLAAADGHPQEAIRILQTTIASASKSGYLGYRLESQLALAEVEITSGRVGAGLSLLEEVRRQAQQKGFQLIAYKATRVSVKSAAN